MVERCRDPRLGDEPLPKPRIVQANSGAITFSATSPRDSAASSAA